MPDDQPRHDEPPSPGRSTVVRFWRIFRLLSVLSVVVATVAVLLVVRGDPAPLADVNMLIATALGTGLTVLVGSALMALVFISNSSGHDDAASRIHQENKDR